MNEQHHEEADEGEEIWLISYADMMTLLFGFFVLMYSFAITKATDQERVKAGMAKHFGGTYVPPYDEMAKKIKVQGAENPILANIEVEQSKEGLEITFRSHLLFGSAESLLKPNAQESLSMLIKVIMDNVRNSQILVIGHTDDDPIATKRYPSNWDLSAARAISVVREFESKGYDPKLLMAMGLGSTRPAYPNRDKDGKAIKSNQALNRRVVVKVLAPKAIHTAEEQEEAAIDEANK
ncbi:MAG: OmpA family protein [Bdellovibrionales bacterium]|nr:OmpA family protein [Bdellovibrionales bacterium]